MPRKPKVVVDLNAPITFAPSTVFDAERTVLIRQDFVDKLTASWEARSLLANGTYHTPGEHFTVASEDVGKVRIRQLRAAAESLNIGVGIRLLPVIDVKSKKPTGQFEVHFRAQRKRAQRTKKAKEPATPAPTATATATATATPAPAA